VSTFYTDLSRMRQTNPNTNKSRQSSAWLNSRLTRIVTAFCLCIRVAWLCNLATLHWNRCPRTWNQRYAALSACLTHCSTWTLVYSKETKRTMMLQWSLSRQISTSRTVHSWTLELVPSSPVLSQTMKSSFRIVRSRTVLSLAFSFKEKVLVSSCWGWLSLMLMGRVSRSAKDLAPRSKETIFHSANSRLIAFPTKRTSSWTHAPKTTNVVSGPSQRRESGVTPSSSTTLA